MPVPFRMAKALAAPPRSRFVFGSPCRWIYHVDFTCHLLIPALLRKGDITQQSVWDRSRVVLSQRLFETSPRWQHLAHVWA